MTARLHRSVFLVVVLSVLTMGLVWALPAHAVAPPSMRASISVDGKACTITGTFSWKNQTNVGQAWVKILDTSTGEAAAYNSKFAPSALATDTIEVLAADWQLEAGKSYYVYGYILHLDGSDPVGDTSRTATLRCK